MSHIDQKYNKLVKTVLRDGFHYCDASRNNIDMLQIPNYQLEIDMLKGFPLITTKQIYWKSIVHELIWMLSGATNIDYLVANNVKIWNKDASNFKQGGPTYVGRIYGAQWREWRGISQSSRVIQDQIFDLLKGLKNNFHSRRHIVTAWNPAELNDMALPPCHWAFEIIPCKTPQFTDGFCLKWHQRSCDTFLGIPFDIGLYALLGKLIERETGIPFVTLIGDLSNVHFYAPHIPLAESQMKRSAFNNIVDLDIHPFASLFDLKITDLAVLNYKYHPAIKAELYAKHEDSKS